MNDEILKMEVKKAARAAVKNATAKNALSTQDVNFMKDLDSIPGFSFLPRKDDIRRAERLKGLGYVEMNYSLTSTGAKLTAEGKKYLAAL